MDKIKKGGWFMYEHKTYLYGDIQSIWIEIDGHKFSFGKIKAGTHDLGTATSRECIQITRGILYINGAGYTENDGPCDIKVGDNITFANKEDVTYICCYPDFQVE